jgi:hypothetical protein
VELQEKLLTVEQKKDEVALILPNELHKQSSQPRAKKTMDKKLSNYLKSNCGRNVQGILWGPDPFVSPVTDERVGMTTSGQGIKAGMVTIGGNDVAPLEGEIGSGYSAENSRPPLQRSCFTTM